MKHCTQKFRDSQIAADLVRRIRQGDGQAETELWNHYSRGLFFMLRRRTNDPALAEDLQQRTYEIVIRKLRTDGLNEPDKLVGYLHGTAITLLKGVWRKTARRKTTADSEAIVNIPDNRPGPFDKVSQAETTALVRRLIQSLGVERDRTILRRFYVEDADKESICAELEISSAHFNRVLFRAKRRFKALLISKEGVDDAYSSTLPLLDTGF
jgi:RNA polymerase sigma-70 factor (ECF subfamily)